MSEGDQFRQKRNRDGDEGSHRAPPAVVPSGKQKSLPPSANELAQLLAGGESGTGSTNTQVVGCWGGGALFGGGRISGLGAGPKMSSSGAGDSNNLFEQLGAKSSGRVVATESTNRPAGLGSGGLSGLLSSINSTSATVDNTTSTASSTSTGGITTAGTQLMNQAGIRPILNECGVVPEPKMEVGVATTIPLPPLITPMWLESRDTEPWDLPLMNLPKYSIAKPKGLTAKVYHPVNTMGPVPPPPQSAHQGVKVQKLVKTPEELRKERHHLRVQKQKELDEAYRTGEKQRPADRITADSLKTHLLGKVTLKPSEMQALVQEQREQRQMEHATTNWERHVTAVPQQKAKKLADLARNAKADPRISVYLVSDLAERHPLGRIQVNCEQNWLKGKILWVPSAKYAVVMLWGGRQPMQFLSNLIERRIDWADKYGSGCNCSVAFKGVSSMDHLPTVFVTPYFQGTPGASQGSTAAGSGGGGQPATAQPQGTIQQGGSGGAPRDNEGRTIPFQPLTADPRADAAHCTDIIEFSSTEGAVAYCKAHECVEYWNAAAAVSSANRI